MTTGTETPPKVWTAEDLLAMPDDGVERWVINGRLREKPPEFPGVTMTVRNRHHSAILIAVGTAIKVWLKGQPVPRGQVYGGEAGVRLPGLTTTVGVDVAYAPAGVVAAQSDDATTLLDGVPTLVVEILSPNDTQEQVTEKVKSYRDARVPLVWVINPDDRTVTVYRPGQPPVLYNDTQQVPVSAEMPGFAPPVAELFE
jgi:Uma2 family endonuclease